MDKPQILFGILLGCSLVLALPSNMWEIIENGDKAREKLNFTIDGASLGHVRYVESDIAIDADEERIQREMLSKRESLPLFDTWHKMLWRTRVVPYVIDYTLPDNYGKIYQNCHQKVKESMEYISQKSCLTFRPKVSSDKNWLRFYKGVGCFANIGRRYWESKPTSISLGDMCCVRSIIDHEILHSLGFFHEQSRRDRNAYVNTYLQNVQESMKGNFDITKLGKDHYQGTDYDYRSIMQYSRTAFRINTNVITTSLKFDYNQPLGNSELSETDIKELNDKYRCSVASGWSPWSDMSPCVQQEWGQRLCTRGKVRICLGTENCSGQDAYGVQEIVENCKSNPSLVVSCTYPAEDGHWSTWGEYSKCYSKDGCGLGIRTRERTCTNPVPKNGGKDCVGNFIEKTICRNPKCAGYQHNADVTFDSGFGNWHSTGFTRRTGSGYYSNVGPREDVSRTGYYAVFSAPSSTYPKAGYMTSPLIPKHPGSNKCFILHYQLNGRKYPTETLIVYIEWLKSDGSKDYTNLLRLDYHQGNYWTRRGFTIADARSDYRIVILARSYGAENDVAIDDIFVDGGSCYAYVNNNHKDYHTTCGTYGSKGYCTGEDKLWMARNCAPTCSECKDRNLKCGEWANARECIKNPNYMLYHCCKSCYDLCRNEDGQICSDVAQYEGKCPGWAEAGECTKNPTFMKNHCHKSCYEVLRN